MRRGRGLALILVVGVLGVLAVLGSAFAILSRLERRAAAQRVQGTKAALLARSGIEDTAARLALGQDPRYGGEDWDNSGTLNGFEGAADTEVFKPGILNTWDCPVGQAMRPSFFTCSSTDVGADGNPAPARIRVEGRRRGCSGRMAEGNWALKVEDLNGRIHVNGGALDALDRDPDGPPATASTFVGNPNAASEVAPLVANGVPDHRDVSLEGPNGWLVRLLDNLDTVVTGAAPGVLGNQIVGTRPVGGYRSMDEVRAVLGAARFAQFKGYLTLDAWVDPKIVKPQPMDGRPNRWLDVDDKHRIGNNVPACIGGIPTASAPAGMGVPSSPWIHTLTNVNTLEISCIYPVSFERNYLFSWRQLRIAQPTLESRAPVSINTASEAVLSAVFLGLKGTYLETWEGSAGWDNGFGFYSSTASPPLQGTYPYPARDTEDTPWIRTRLDYGMPYGIPGRPWYGPANYNPAATWSGGDGGKPLVQCAPLGRLKETVPVSRDQAGAIAREIASRIQDLGPFRTWAEFNRFVDLLPVSEDADANGSLDGPTYTVTGTGSAYSRRRYEREDLDDNGVMMKQVFPPVPGSASGTWASGPSWADVGTGSPGAGQILGLTRQQKDVLKAMANPNTDLNDFNPDKNLWKEVDKTDLAGFLRLPPLASGLEWEVDARNAYVHTTELALSVPLCPRVHSLGRAARGDKTSASRTLGGVIRFSLSRHTTQADFMAGYLGGAPLADTFPAPASPPVQYGPAGNQTAVSYPEPQTVLSGGASSRAADATYDGQIGLGFVTRDEAGPSDQLGGDLFDTLDAGGAAVFPAQPDARGPFQYRLVRPPGVDVGNLFPDGGYSEKDASLKFPFQAGGQGAFAGYVMFWFKPNWSPEASPRPHSLFSLAWSVKPGKVSSFPGKFYNSWTIFQRTVPIDDISSRPNGAYWVPARNNYLGTVRTTKPYVHSSSASRGAGSPSRSLILGWPHGMYTSESLNLRGLPGAPTRPVGRFEAHRWQHVALFTSASNPAFPGMAQSWITVRIGRKEGSSLPDPGGMWAASQQGYSQTHSDGTPNHGRFGEIAGLHNMNHTADATFAVVRSGFFDAVSSPEALAYVEGAQSPWVLGRYYKDDRAIYVSPPFPAGTRPARLTWTEIPADLWFDDDGNGWEGDGGAPRNDRFSPGGVARPDGKRDVRIEIEAWDDARTPADRTDDRLLAVFSDPARGNPVPAPSGRLYYKAVFRNQWDDDTRLNTPLLVTPFLDDVSLTCTGAGGVEYLDWGEDGEE